MLAGDISQPPAEMGSFVLAGGLCRPPALRLQCWRLFPAPLRTTVHADVSYTRQHANACVRTNRFWSSVICRTLLWTPWREYMQVNFVFGCIIHALPAGCGAAASTLEAAWSNGNVQQSESLPDDNKVERTGACGNPQPATANANRAWLNWSRLMCHAHAPGPNACVSCTWNAAQRMHESWR
jgi:hypothetical protein